MTRQHLTPWQQYIASENARLRKLTPAQRKALKKETKRRSLHDEIKREMERTRSDPFRGIPMRD
jgi:hypothetical protein